MGSKGAVEIIYRGQKDLHLKEEEYKRKFANPFPAAARGFLDDIVEPATTRTIICSDLDMLRTKQLTNPVKKHSNIPL